MSTAAVFLDIEKAFDTTWHSGLLYKLSKLEFSTSEIKIIDSFLPQRKFSVSVEGAMSTPREIQAGMPQVSVLSLYSFQYVYKCWPPNTWCSSRTLCRRHLYTTDHKEGFVVRKLQRGLSSMKAWRERWNIKINEEKTRGSTSLGVVDSLSLILH
jgi:hypothetical protein